MFFTLLFSLKKLTYLLFTSFFIVAIIPTVASADENPIIGEDLILEDIAYTPHEINYFNHQLINDKEKLNKLFKRHPNKQNKDFDSIFQDATSLDIETSTIPKLLLGLLYKMNNIVTEQNASLVAYLFHDITINSNTDNTNRTIFQKVIIDALLLQEHLSANDSKRMYYWLTKAAKENSSDAAYHLGTKYFIECNNHQNNKILQNLARNYLTQAANNGRPDAGLTLGLYYQMYDKNPTEAAKWMQIAAEAGEPKAAGQLGIMYVTGEGVEIDYNKAFYWAKKGSDAGDCTSMGILGALYENGIGTKTSTKKALSYYNSSCKLGCSGGCKNYDSLYQKLN